MFLPDESETAVQANAILKHGWPKVDDDGSRILPFIFGWLRKDGGWIHTPWLDDYVLAGSAKLLGPTRWSARFPFALIALGGLLLFMVLARRLLSPEAAWLAILLYALSAVYIGQARFARYYVILHLSEILFLLGAHEVVCRKRNRGIGYLIIAHFLCFYCNYISSIMHALSLAIWSLLLGRPYRHRLTSVALVYLGSFVVSLPWLIYINFKLFGEIGTLTFFSDANRIHSGPQFGLSKVLHRMQEYAVGFEMCLYPMIIIVPALVIAWLTGHLRGQREFLSEPSKIVLSPSMILLCGIHSVATILFCGFLPVYAERYICFLLPSAKILLGATVALFDVKWTKYILWMVLVTEIVCHPLRLIYPQNVDSLVHSSNLLTGFRSIFTRSDDQVMDFVESQPNHGGTVQTVGEEMYLLYRYPHRKFECADYGVKPGSDMPDVVLTESLMGYYDYDHYVPLMEDWLSFYDRVEIPVSPEAIHPPWLDGPARPWIVYLKRKDAPERSPSLSENPAYRKCWLGGGSLLLQPFPSAEDVDVLVTRSVEGPVELTLGALRPEAFLRGGFVAEKNARYRIKLRADERVRGIQAFVRDADRLWEGEASEGRQVEPGAWWLDLVSPDASKFTQIVLRLDVDGQSAVLGGWSVEKINDDPPH
jgi:hypothetical protein